MTDRHLASFGPLPDRAAILGAGPGWSQQLHMGLPGVAGLWALEPSCVAILGTLAGTWVMSMKPGLEPVL